MIEVGKRYKVEPTYKKSVEEIETFENEDKTKYVNLIELWRWGEYYVTPQNEHEVEILQKGMEEEGICITDFEEWELDNTWDGCATDLHFYGPGWTEEDKEAFEEEYFENYYEAMENHGFMSVDCEVYIHTKITAVEVDDDFKPVEE